MTDIDPGFRAYVSLEGRVTILEDELKAFAADLKEILAVHNEALMKLHEATSICVEAMAANGINPPYPPTE